VPEHARGHEVPSCVAKSAAPEGWLCAGRTALHQFRQSDSRHGRLAIAGATFARPPLESCFLLVLVA
jgi:hypothetical protein